MRNRDRWHHAGQGSNRRIGWRIRHQDGDVDAPSSTWPNCPDSARSGRCILLAGMADLWGVRPCCDPSSVRRPAMTEPKDLLLVVEQLRRSNRRWKALTLAACSLLVLVVL